MQTPSDLGPDAALRLARIIALPSTQRFLDRHAGRAHADLLFLAANDLYEGRRSPHETGNLLRVLALRVRGERVDSDVREPITTGPGLCAR